MMIEQHKRLDNDKSICIALFSLLCIGEIGSQNKVSNEELLFCLLTDLFHCNISEGKITSAISLGALSCGHVEYFLPKILSVFQYEKNMQSLYLRTLKEITTRCLEKESRSFFQCYAEDIQTLVLKSCDFSQEEQKTLAGDVIFRLWVGHKSTSFILSLFESSSSEVRELALAVFLSAFSNGKEHTNKELLTQHLGKVFLLAADSQLSVRKRAFSVISTLIYGDPPLLESCIDKFLPLLLKQTLVDETLIKEVHMGPFVHRKDDGVELRKAAYEILRAVIENYDISDSLSLVMTSLLQGLKDDDDVKLIVYRILRRAVQIFPQEIYKSYFHFILFIMIKFFILYCRY
jgi:cullin-associated NEDD8-dissociated protein 1